MRYAIFGPDGRIESAHNDDTIEAFPPGAVELTQAQWEKRFDLELVDGALLDKPASDIVPTIDQLVARYEAALDAHLDAVAKADRWRDRFTFALRAGYNNPWQTKAIAFGSWMDSCNAQAYDLLAAVVAGTESLPTIDDFIAALPPAPVLP